MRLPYYIHKSPRFGHIYIFTFYLLTWNNAHIIAYFEYEHVKLNIIFYLKIFEKQ